MSEWRPSAVLFDYGGVFTDPAPVEEELLRYDQILGLPAGTVLRALASGEAWEAVSVGQIEEAEYWHRAMGTYLDRLPRDFERFRSGVLLAERVRPEVIAIARALHGQVPLGLLSNATLGLRAALRARAGFLELFDDVVISAEVGLRKPDRRIYELAARRLGVACADALLIDDKRRNTEAAAACGMRSILFSSAEQLRPELRALGYEL
jgi:putative hydrolase of the HAD superfamily